MSKRFFSPASFDILELDLEYWAYPKHSHNFFELVFIKSGNGTHVVNDSSLDYNKGDLFLLTPNDEHEFKVKERTVFGHLKFTEQLFIEKTELVSDLKWRKQIDPVIFHANSTPGSIINRTLDSSSVFQIYELIKIEFENPSTYGRSILLELFGALLMIISRNLSTQTGNSLISEADKVNDILTYIRQNVLNNEKLKIKEIAKEFNMSTNYVSIYIKKHAGISIQQYAVQTKIKMAERLLKQTSLTITEIAQKMGFTDSSHFTKMFKKHKGVTPKVFRKENS